MVTSLPFDQEVPASTPGSFLGFFCNGELLHGMNVLIVLLVTSDIKGGGIIYETGTEEQSIETFTYET